MRKRAVLLKLLGICLCVLLLCSSLAACKDTTPDRFMEAIEAEIQEWQSDPTRAFGMEMTENVSRQVWDQYEKDRPEPLRITVELLITDVTAMQAKDIFFRKPDFELQNPNSALYYGEYIKAATEALTEYSLRTETAFQKTITLDMLLTTKDGQWLADADPDHVQQITETLKREIDIIAESWAKEDTDYRHLILTENFQETLTQADVEGWLIPALHPEQILQLSDGGYALHLSMPNPREIYNRSGQTVLQRMKKDKTRIFGEISEERLSQEIRHANLLPADLPNATETRTIQSQNLEDFTDSMDQFIKELATARRQELQSTKQEIDRQIAVPVLERPQTGVLFGESTGVFIELRTSAELEDVCIRLYRLPTEDMSEDGELTMVAYVRAGEQLPIRVPAGNYRVVKGYGETWYGTEFDFGPDGTYHLTNDVMKIGRGYAYTLHLYDVEAGNLPSQSIPYPY